MGYSDTSKSFRIYIPALRRVVLKRDVKFEEEKAYRRSWELNKLQPSVDQQQNSSQGTGSQGTGYKWIGYKGYIDVNDRSVSEWFTGSDEQCITE